MTAAMVENQNAYEDLVFGVSTNPTDPYSHAPIQAEMDVKTGGVTYTIENEPEMRVVPKLSLLVENESSMLKYVGEDIHSTIAVSYTHLSSLVGFCPSIARSHSSFCSLS